METTNNIGSKRKNFQDLLRDNYQVRVEMDSSSYLLAFGLLDSDGKYFMESFIAPMLFSVDWKR